VGLYYWFSVWSFLWLEGRARGGVGRRLVCFGFGGLIGCALARLTLFGATRRYTEFFSPPKFCFAPEPVCLDTERRRQSSVPFSGHLSRAI